MSSTIEWMPAEWSEFHEAADLNGVEGVVALEADEEGKFGWVVKPTGERSEWPEVFATGANRTVDAARKQCEQRMRMADRSYGRPFANA